MKRYLYISIFLFVTLLFFGCQQKEDKESVETTTVQTEIESVGSEETNEQTAESQTEEMTTTTSTEAVSDRYMIPIFEEIDMETFVFKKGVNYNGDPAWLRLDIYTPAGDEEISRPVIVWIHGGGFERGNDRSQGYIVTLANEFARRGYVSISTDYRVRDDPSEDWPGTINDAIEDIMLAVDWIRENASLYGIDNNRIIIAGGSAGGVAGVNFCIRDDSTDSPWDKTGILGLVDLWGSPDKSKIYSRIDSSDPSVLIIHGTEDDILPYSNSEWLYSEFQLNGIKCELVPLDGAGHTPEDRMEEIIGFTEKFISELIK